MFFGKLISEARKKKQYSLKECAALLSRENGEQISVQYLNDIEKNRRNPPPEYILLQFSSILDIPIEVLYFYSGKLPSNLKKEVTENQIISAFQAFLEKLDQKNLFQ